MTDRTHIFAVAPMMGCTDRHGRYFLRLISRHARLYTEMIVANALVHGDPERHLKFDPAEHPIALQVGGSEPRPLAAAARLAADYGYDEINLNVGCPSRRVSDGRFGARLMAEPDLVAALVGAMRAAGPVPVSVKCRIGIDDQPEDALFGFVERVAAAGCNHFIVHARKAWLRGISPKANREIPPLNHGLVYRLKRQFPALSIVINGGLTDLDMALDQCASVDGVMLGRAAYRTPYLLADVDRRFFAASAPPRTRRAVLQALIPYVEAELGRGTRLHHITGHIIGLAHGLAGARRWRQLLTTGAARPGAGIEVLQAAAAEVDFDGLPAAA